MTLKITFKDAENSAVIKNLSFEEVLSYIEIYKKIISTWKTYPDQDNFEELNELDQYYKERGYI